MRDAKRDSRMNSGKKRCQFLLHYSLFLFYLFHFILVLSNSKAAALAIGCLLVSDRFYFVRMSLVNWWRFNHYFIDERWRWLLGNSQTSKQAQQNKTNKQNNIENNEETKKERIEQVKEEKTWYIKEYMYLRYKCMQIFVFVEVRQPITLMIHQWSTRIIETLKSNSHNQQNQHSHLTVIIRKCDTAAKVK